MKKKGVAVALSASMLMGSMGGMTVHAEEPVKLTAMYVSHSLTQSLDDMQWLQEIEEAAGVDIEWEQIYSDWDTVKSTRFASGDIPDILFRAASDSDFTTYGGLFMDMTDLIEEYAPNIQEMFEELPDSKILATTLDGSIYGIPNYLSKWPKTNTAMFINKTWLDNLGLEVPTTFTELQTVLEAFKAEDANGNGNADDEIPLDFNSWFGSAYSVVNLIGGLGIQITNWGTDGYFVEDGVVKNYAVDERYKDFMKYLNGLYSEGLINENAITNDYSVFQSLSRGDSEGNALVGVTFGWEETDKFGVDLADEYVAFGPLTWDVDDNTYDTRWTYDFSGLNMYANTVAMSANCSNPEAAMKFIDQFYGETTSVEVLFGGISDGCIEQTGDHSYKVLAPLDESVDSGTWKWTMTMADWGPKYVRDDVEIEMTQDMVNAVNEREVYEETFEKVDTDSYYPQIFMKYSVDDQNTLAMDQANITNITNNYWSLWLVGSSDIDADWDDYVAAVDAAGMQEVLAIRQAAYDNYVASLE